MCGQCHRMASRKAGPQQGLSLGRWSALHPLEGDTSPSLPFSHMLGARPFSGPMNPRRGHLQPGIGFKWTRVLASALREPETTSRRGFLRAAPGSTLHHALSKSLLSTLPVPPFLSNSHSKPHSHFFTPFGRGWPTHSKDDWAHWVLPPFLTSCFLRRNP